MNRWMTRLALGRSGGLFGASGFSSSAAVSKPASFKIEKRPSPPKPMPQRRRSSRRLRGGRLSTGPHRMTVLLPNKNTPKRKCRAVCHAFAAFLVLVFHRRQHGPRKHAPPPSIDEDELIRQQQRLGVALQR